MNERIPLNSKALQQEGAPETFLDEISEKARHDNIEDEYLSFKNGLSKYNLSNPNLKSYVQEVFSNRDLTLQLSFLLEIYPIMMGVSDTISDILDSISDFELKDSHSFERKYYKHVESEVMNLKKLFDILSGIKLDKDAPAFVSLLKKIAEKEILEAFLYHSNHNPDTKLHEYYSEKSSEYNQEYVYPGLPVYNIYPQKISNDFWGYTEDGKLMIARSSPEKTLALENLEREINTKLSNVKESVSLSNLFSKRNNILKEIEKRKAKPITVNDVYRSSTIEKTSEELTKEFMFLKNMSGFLGSYLKVDFLKLSLGETFLVLQYLETKNEESLNKVLKIASKFPANNNFWKTFLSIEHGGQEMGDKILTIGEKLPKNIAEKVFTKYSEYIDAVENTDNFVTELYTKQKPKPEVVQKIKENLLVKGKNILLSQYEKIQTGTFDEKKFQEFIDGAKADIDLFKNTFKITLEENPDTNFEDFLGMRTEMKPGTEIEQSTIQSIDTIIEKNYKEEELRNSVKNSFHQSLHHPTTQVSVLKREDKIIASNRIDFKEDGTLYFGTFNVDPDYCSSKIGDAFFKATILPYMEKHVIQADCSARQPISAYYIESGFIGTALYDYNGEPSLSIETTLDSVFDSKKLSKKEVLDLLDSGDTKYTIRKFANQEDITHNYPADKKLTRFFFDRNSKEWIALWE
ncbi:MAG: hypothetical protein K9M36_01275 [Candidatus Pacebacteria bacterium]|nr:hypothetical protein [Candidatus Paceibacterota bacterium]